MQIFRSSFLLLFVFGLFSVEGLFAQQASSSQKLSTKETVYDSASVQATSDQPILKSASQNRSVTLNTVTLTKPTSNTTKASHHKVSHDKPDNEADSKKVYICDSKTSYAYHSTSSCKGLSRCTHQILIQARKDVQESRSPCKLCY